MLSRLAAAHASIADMLLFEGDAAGFDSRKILNFILTFFIAAPHSLDKAISGIGDLQKFSQLCAV